MPSSGDKRTCPYCGHEIVLGRCPIVATEVIWGGNLLGGAEEAPGADLFAETDTAGARSSRGKPASGRHVDRWVGKGWPVLAEPPLPENPSRLARLRNLPPADRGLPFEDLPARACTSCWTPLPLDIDTRRIVTIAVVGMQGASKTHFLAAMLQAASHDQALEGPLGCSEFAPDEATAERFHANYFQRLFGTNNIFDPTPADLDVRFRPLAFRATFDRAAQPITLLFHDVAGELFTKRAQRNQAAPFVRRADGLVFVVDPTWYASVHSYLYQRYGIDKGSSPTNQADLLNAVAHEMEPSHLASVPVAVTVSKADLLAGAFGRAFRFDKPSVIEQTERASRHEWFADINDVSVEVETEVFGRELGRDLLAAARRYQATYHAVSPLGDQPTADGIVDEIKPRRCLEPLVSVLTRLPGITI